MLRSMPAAWGLVKVTGSPSDLSGGSPAAIVLGMRLCLGATYTFNTEP